MNPSANDLAIAYANGGAQTQANNAFGDIAPYVNTVSSAPSAPQQVLGQTQGLAPSSTVGKVGAFLGNLGSEIGHIGGQVAEWLGKSALNMVEAPYKLGEGAANAFLDTTNLNALNTQAQQNTNRLQTLTQAFRSGRITSSQYQQSLKALNQDFTNIGSAHMALSNKINTNAASTKQATVDTALLVGTILTAGIGGAPDALITKTGLQPLEAKTAADYLASTNANALLGNVEKGISKLASDPAAFAKLNSTAQFTLQHATAEILAARTLPMTTAQSARAVAVNVALKYPIYYGMMEPQATQIYKELDQRKYGQAIRNIAFQSALLLSGGPIGEAMKFGGKALAGLSARTFGQSSFIDAVGKGIWGDEAAIYNAIKNMPLVDRAAAVRGLSAVEAINMAATGGKDAQAAAWRLIKGMQGYESLDLKQFTPEELVTNMVKFAKNQEIADYWGKKLGMQMTVGRFDVRAKTMIANELAKSPDASTAWEMLKKQNPNEAWANNTNLDNQIKNLIAKHGTTNELAAAIQDIKAGTTIEGVPKAVISAMEKDGYIPIAPKAGVEAPFQAGTGKLATKFAVPGRGENDFFIKTVQPLPVLRQTGALFTALGLSPNASTERAYQLFNDNLARNLAETKAFKGLQVTSDALTQNARQQTDTIIKQLSDYAHGLKFPTKDLRMLTQKDVMKALDVSKQQATEIQNAISMAHIQVPLAVRGLGDAAVDWSYQLPGSSSIMRRYMKVQGALRFSFNPFFQYLRVIPKTEILTQAEGRGYLASIFGGRYSQIEPTRSLLHDGGFLNEPGSFRAGNVISGEAEAGAGFVGRNINKQLLPMQERSIAGLVDAQAQRMGMSAEEYMQAYPQQVRDTVQAIAEYDRKGNFINSPLMRTLNVAFFPARFDTKVAQIFAKNLAKSSLLTQVSVINGLMRFNSFMQSPEGKAWYAQNADAIGLFKYITPVASLNEVFHSLLPGNDHSLGNFGELGGLPFGWIPQLLDAEGLTQFNQPYQDAKTGEMIPNYIPKTATGQAAIAIQDLIGSLFSYPGAEIGLPSKTSLTRSIGEWATGAKSGTDLQKQDVQPNAQQAAYAQAIGANNPQQPIAPTPPVQVTQVTPTGPTTASPKYKNGTPMAKKKKKADFTPALLPGQSQLGQL